MDELKNRREKSHELEDRSLEITHPEKQRKQASGMVTVVLTPMSTEIQRGPQERQMWLKEYLDEQHLKMFQIWHMQNQSQNRKQPKTYSFKKLGESQTKYIKEAHSKIHDNKIEDKEKKSWREPFTHSGWNHPHDSGFLIANYGDRKKLA